MDAEATTLVTTVIWTLRICLPIILFLLYYRVPFPSIFPKKHRHPRDLLLQLRPVRARPPPEMSNIGLVDQATRPDLFVVKKRGKDKDKDKAEPDAPQPASDGKLPPQDMLHLESLLNYMAFNRKSHRIFHPLQAPPPPSAPPPPRNASPSSDFQEKANLDAQMVLEGALMFKKLDVVQDVYDSLTNTKVAPTEKTFSLMVDVCLAAHDLPKASDFLMKMEQCQYQPDVVLLDRVMELYAQHKVTAELGQRLHIEKQRENGHDGTSGLSADAPEFVPTAGFDSGWWDNHWGGEKGKPWAGEWKGKKGKKGMEKGKPKGSEKGKGKGWEPEAKGKKGDKGKGKGKAKGAESAMPQKEGKPGAVWRKKESSEPAEES